VNTVARDKLCEAVARYGPDLCDEPQRCESILNDLCHGNREEVRLLVTIAKEGVASDLRASSSGVPHDLLLSKHIRNLQSFFFTEQAAKWGIESWALALGIISDADISRAAPQSTQSNNDQTTPANATAQRSDDVNTSLSTPHFWVGIALLIVVGIIAVVALILKYQADGRATEALAAKQSAEQTLTDLQAAKANSERQANTIIQEKTKALEAAEDERKKLQSLMPSVDVDNLHVDIGYNSITLHAKFRANNLQSVQCVVDAYLYDENGNEVTYWNKPVTDGRSFTPTAINSVYDDVSMSIYQRSIGLRSGIYSFKVAFRRQNGELIDEADSEPFSYVAN
jgi:hypothetical protein